MVVSDFIVAIEAAQKTLNIYGAFGIAFGCLAGLMPRRRLILVCSGVGSACFGLHNLTLGATTGAALCTLSVLQSLAAYAAPEEGDQPGWLLGVLGLAAVLIVAATIATWQGWPSLCAGLGSLVATRARLERDPHRMRQGLLASSLCWVGHNCLAGSVYGLVSDTLTITGHICGLRQNRNRLPALADARLQPA